MDVTTILTENIAVGFVIGFLIGIRQNRFKGDTQSPHPPTDCHQMVRGKKHFDRRLASIDKWTDWPTRIGPQSNH